MGDAPAWDVPFGFTEWALLATTATSDVYVATWADGDEPTVVKILRVDAEFEMNSLFLEGTDAAETLPRHPLVLPVTGRGLTPGGRPWVTMPFLAHGSLSDRLLGEGPLAPQLATEIFVWVSDALTFTTAAGVLHRDVKPGNILFDDEGRPVLADFQTSTRLRPGRQSATTASLTDQYAAPEVLIRGRYTAQSEVFSVCASLLQALGGRPPHGMRPGEALGAYLMRVDAGTAVEQVAVTGAPEPLLDVVRRGLARDPELRPSGPRGLARALRDAQGAIGWPVTGPIADAAPPAPPTVIRRPLPPDGETVPEASVRVAPPRPRRRLAVLTLAPLVALLAVAALVITGVHLMTTPRVAAATAALRGPTSAGARTTTGSSSDSVTASGTTVTLPDIVTDVGSRPAPPTTSQSVTGTATTAPPPIVTKEKSSITSPIVTVDPGPVIEQTLLDQATVGQPYTGAFRASGGESPYTWEIVSGALPAGLTMDQSAQITGTPTDPETPTFTVQVQDAAGKTSTWETTLAVVTLVGDLNQDGAVDCLDYAIFETSLNSGGSDLRGDLNNDGSVGADDLAILNAHWTGPSGTCPSATG